MAIDGRSMNHMDPSTKAAHLRLEEWGRWTRDDDAGLGFPRRAVTEKAGEGGIMAGSPRPPTLIPEQVAHVDAAVARLGQIDQKVIRTYYQFLAPTIETMARRHHMRVRQFQNVLRRARWRIRISLESNNG